MRKHGLICFTFILLFVFREEVVFSEEYQIEKIYETHGSIILVIEGETGRIVDYNKAAQDFYGYSKEEFLQLNISDINRLPATEIKKEMDLAIKEERNYFIFQHQVKNGEIHHVEVYTSPIISKEGKPLLFSIIHDITPRINAEEESRQNRQLIIFGLILLFTLLSVMLLLFNQTKEKEKKKKSDISYCLIK